MANLNLQNNAYSALAAGIGIGDTSITVTTGQGDRFPAVSSPAYFKVTLQDASNNIEIVQVTARTGGSDSMTIVRAQEGTTARSWSLGDVVELRVTAGILAPLTVLDEAATAADIRTAIDVPRRTVSTLIGDTATDTMTVESTSTFNAPVTIAAALTATTNGNKLSVSGTGSTFAVSPASAGTLDNVAIGGTTAAAGTFTSLTANGNTILGDASGDTLTINGTAVSIPNNLNFDSNTFFIDAANNRVGVGTATPNTFVQVVGVDAGAGLIYIDEDAAASNTAPIGLYLRKDGSSDGNVSPSIFFDVGGGGGNAEIYTERLATPGGLLRFATENSSGTMTRRVLIDEDGALVVGANSASGFGGADQQVIINGSSNARLEFGLGGSQLGGFFADSNGIIMYTSNSGDRLSLQTVGTERVLVSAQGYVKAAPDSTYTNSAGTYHELIQSDTNPLNRTCIVWHKATTGNNVFVEWNTETSSTGRGSIDYNRGAGQVRYNVTSDRRLKSNIVDLTNSGTIIDALQPRQYVFTETGQTCMGFIADEFQSVLPCSASGTPDAVDEEGNPVYMNIAPSSSAMMATIVAELQSVRGRLTALEAA